MILCNEGISLRHFYDTAHAENIYRNISVKNEKKKSRSNELLKTLVQVAIRISNLFYYQDEFDIRINNKM